MSEARVQLHLVRHGRTASNAAGTYTGMRDVSLSEEGCEGLRQLLTNGTYGSVTEVFVSPLKRCRETAELLFPNATKTVCEGLIEYNFGEYEGHTAVELRVDPAYQLWTSGTPDAAPAGGETVRGFTERIRETVLGLVEQLAEEMDGTEIALVSHGGVIMTIMSLFAEPKASATDWFMVNGTGYTVTAVLNVAADGTRTVRFENIHFYPETPENRDLTPDPTAFKNFLPTPFPTLKED